MLHEATGERRMAYTLAKAARAIGMQKSTVLRAIKRGTLSAVRDAATGQWLVEPAELHRVYPAINDSGASIGAPDPDTPLRTDSLEAELREARALRAAAEKRCADAHATIEDLRRRLDASDMERRQTLDRLAAAQERIAALLTDQRPPVPARHRWWRWHQ